MNELRVRTPEGVVFSFLLASPISRLLAWVIDAFMIIAFSTAIGSCVGILAAISYDLARAITIISYFAISVGYGMALEWYWRGQTVGKRLMRLRVMDEQGLRLRFNQIAIRNLLRAVDILPAQYLVGGIVALSSRRAQRLGDFAANTVVVRMPRMRQPDLDQLASGKFNSLRQYPHLEARLRQRVSPAEAAVLLEALLRRDRLDPVARVTLLGELAAHCKEVVQFPPEATDSLADEQYVRNVVEVLFRKQSSGAAAKKAPARR